MKLKISKFNIAFIVVFLIFVAWKVYSSIKEDDEQFFKLRKAYPTLLIQDSIDCKVSNRYKYNENYRGTMFVVHISTTDNKKATINSYKCLTNADTNLGDVVKVGSIIQKKPNIDTFKVINGKKEIRFILREKL